MLFQIEWFEEGLVLAETKTGLTRPRVIYNSASASAYFHWGSNYAWIELGLRPAPECKLPTTNPRLDCMFTAVHEFGHYRDWVRLGWRGYVELRRLSTIPTATQAEYLALPIEQSANEFALDLLRPYGLTDIEQVFYL